jgi:hypothetical protein
MLAGLALGLQGASAAYSWWNSREQAKQQRRETDEAVRRFDGEFQQRLGAARAAGAASGIEFESVSLKTHLAGMQDEFAREVQWMREAGASGAKATERAGDFGLVGDLGAAVFGYGNANNWWRGAKP